MATTMGVAMGFLAFLVIGGLSSVFAWVFYPGQRKSKPSFQKLLLAIFIGFMASLASSYLGQFAGFFQSGQMLEWLCVTIAACLAGCLYATTAK
ncbi:MAG: hypothetical protein Q7K13_11220 [Polynucleobacter sp.]|nr:hypothetical protein [Polynucleobacter sp.]